MVSPPLFARAVPGHKLVYGNESSTKSIAFQQFSMFVNFLGGSAHLADTFVHPSQNFKKKIEKG